MVFAPTKSGLGGAHPTERSMAGLPEHAKERIRTLRDAPLHHTELVGAVELLRIALVHIQRYLEERPDWHGIRALIDDFKEMVDTEFAVFPVFLQNEELLATAAFYIKSELATLQPLGSLSALSTLLQMFSLTHVHPPSLELQRIYDLEVQPDGFGNFLYQWRLIDINMYGLVVGAGGAVGSGTFELQRVDADGNTIPPVISRDIDLFAVQGGTDLQVATYEGPGDFDDWMYLSPSGRDIVPALDGATLSLIGFAGGVAVVVESTGTIDVTLSPNDDLPPLTGRIDPVLIDVPLFAPAPEEIDPADAYDRAEQVNELKDIVKEAIEKGYEKYVEKGLKKGIKAGAKKAIKSIPVDFNGFTLDGWIRTADGQPTRPDPAPVPVSEYAGNDDDWARFAFDEYELTDEFRNAIRQFLLENLPLLTGAGEVVIEGNASRLAREEAYNVRLSRDRAGSVLLAMYDILGPQIGIPWGDLRVRGLGSSQSTDPDPESDLALDRRVDVTIAGSIRMRS
jgi:outer membrane protein OmpA-like peptidoglycan-associated protein